MGSDTNQWRVGACLKVFLLLLFRFFYGSRYLCEFDHRKIMEKEKMPTFFSVRQTLMNQYESFGRALAATTARPVVAEVAEMVEKYIYSIHVYNNRRP